jgi:hypothetical protein
MVTENVSNTAEACREKPKKWDETYKVDFVNNIDVDTLSHLYFHISMTAILVNVHRKIVY